MQHYIHSYHRSRTLLWTFCFNDGGLSPELQEELVEESVTKVLTFLKKNHSKKDGSDRRMAHQAIHDVLLFPKIVATT